MFQQNREFAQDQKKRVQQLTPSRVSTIGIPKQPLALLGLFCPGKKTIFIIPTDAGSTGHRPILESASNAFYYVYPRRQNSGLLYSVERSTNLVEGVWATNDCVELPGAGPIDADFKAVTNRIPARWNEAFIRLRIEQQ